MNKYFSIAFFQEIEDRFFADGAVDECLYGLSQYPVYGGRTELCG